MNQSFKKYKNLWISINSIIEDQPQNIQNKFDLFEDPMNGFDNTIDYNGEYNDLLEFKGQITDKLNQSYLNKAKAKDILAVAKKICKLTGFGDPMEWIITQQLVALGDVDFEDTNEDYQKAFSKLIIIDQGEENGGYTDFFLSNFSNEERKTFSSWLQPGISAEYMETSEFTNLFESNNESRLAKERAWLNKYAKYIGNGTYPENEFNSEEEFYDDVERTEKMIEYLSSKIKSINQQKPGQPSGSIQRIVEKRKFSLKELSKIWHDTYGEDFQEKYPGIANHLYNEFSLKELKDYWMECFGEYFEEDCPSVYKELLRNAIKESKNLNESSNKKIKLDYFTNLWSSLYEEYFDQEYPAVYDILSEQDNFELSELERIWKESYGEIFIEEYYGIYDWLKSKKFQQLNESQNQFSINSPREYLNSLFGKRIDTKDYEKINNNVVSKFGSSVVNLFASTEGADKVDNAAKYQQYFKSNQKIMESKLLNEAKNSGHSDKIAKEELLDNFYFMFKNQHKDKIANKEPIKYSDIKTWFASAYKSDQIDFKEFYKKFRDDDDVKVITESEVETFEDGDIQKIDQIFGTMKKIKDGITDASRKIDDFVESDSNIDKLACKIQEGLNAGYSNIDNMLEQLGIELGYKSKQKLVENLKKKNIPVFETDPMNLQIGSMVTNESGIVGKIFDIQENRIIYQSGAEIITESNESVYLVESEMNQSDEQKLEEKYKQDKIYLIENWDKLFELLNLDESEFELIQTFDKLEGDNDQRPDYSIIEVLSDALDKNHIVFNYNKLFQFFNR